MREEAKDLMCKCCAAAGPPQEICALVVRIARETGWGYSGILGELRKLYALKISRTTVKTF